MNFMQPCILFPINNRPLFMVSNASTIASTLRSPFFEILPDEARQPPLSFELPTDSVTAFWNAVTDKNGNREFSDDLRNAIMGTSDGWRLIRCAVMADEIIFVIMSKMFYAAKEMDNCPTVLHMKAASVECSWPINFDIIATRSSGAPERYGFSIEPCGIMHYTEYQPNTRTHYTINPEAQVCDGQYLIVQTESYAV